MKKRNSSEINFDSEGVNRYKTYGTLILTAEREAQKPGTFLGEELYAIPIDTTPH